ncbi:hypothetical protein DUI87_21494 [Hirundo rustica rustica]|uniref:Uncharacterized protein n=1 Tax=Hirundo rustica rustica TaxID=333673 RepID=A0A3M0JMY2_HIRRU|nr:hypothetical protein DUI87_21494 [Hirundo rustica rustica]
MAWGQIFPAAFRGMIRVYAGMQVAINSQELQPGVLESGINACRQDSQDTKSPGQADGAEVHKPRPDVSHLATTSWDLCSCLCLDALEF